VATGILVCSYQKNDIIPEHMIHGIKFKSKKCVICKDEFIPSNPRQLKCFKHGYCLNCGKKLNVHLTRLKSHERFCMKCHLDKVPVGSRRMDFNNYIRLKTESGWTLEHRFLMEKYIGRKLEDKEIVHHKDGNPSNNEISNLILCKNLRDHFDSHHKANLKNPPTHHFGKKKWGEKEYKEFYG
jgi:hypothetical protein